MRQELKDRFGESPTPVQRMLDIAELKMDATLWSIRSISIEDHFLCFLYTDARRIQQLSDKHQGQLRIIDRQTAYWPLWDPKPVSEPARKPGTPRTQPTKELSDAQRLAKVDLLAVLRQILRW
jgi:transcription-repair coupling factor (superfamily II helicase)